MGWLFFAIFAGLMILIAWRSNLPRGALPMVAAAVALAAAGYAAQGRPGLAASPGPPSDRDIGDLAERLFSLRADMDRNFGPHVAPLALSDSALRGGNRAMAVAAINGALTKYPDNPELLNGRALALYIATQGETTPAVRLAYEQARVGNEHPGPDYFEGLGYLFANEIDEAERLWASALERRWPPGEWRANVEAQLSTLRAVKEQAELAAEAQARDEATETQARPEATGNE